MPAARRVLSARCGVVAAALCGALAAPVAQGAVTLPDGVAYQPAPLSALSTRRDLRFVTARWAAGDLTVTVLAHQPDPGATRPVALLRQHRSQAWTSVRRLPLSDGPAPSADLALAVIEQLYAMVFRLDPLARYCIDPGPDEIPAACQASGAEASHGRTLQALAALREQAAAHRPAALPWHRVEITPVPWPSPDVDTVGVRVVGPGGSIERKPIHFNRAPHSICIARTDAEGLASCRLEDQHGDGSQHSHASEVVAIFPGELRPDRVLLPTTLVLPLATAPPAFARPITLPLGRPGAASGP